MNEGKEEKDFITVVRKQLDGECDRLDAGTLSRLNRARQTALASGSGDKAGYYFRRMFMPAAGVALASFLFLLSTQYLGKERGDIQVSHLEDFEVIVAADSPDFFAELEFYIWLAEEEEHAG